MDNLSGFQRDLLYIIAGLEAPKGLAIKDELDVYYDAEVNHSRLYRNLDELVEKGFVGKGKKSSQTNEYTLTSRGSQRIQERREWVDKVLDEQMKADAW